jgi:nuclear pore complex protein Nup107
LLLEDIKQEAADYTNMDGLDGSRSFSLERRRGSPDGGFGSDAAFNSGRLAMKLTFKSVKMEEDMDVSHEGGANFTTFAPLLDCAIQGWYNVVV